jgi:putative endonuclease
MQNTTKKTWDNGEIIAIKYLQKNWYSILDTNFKFGRFWEIDIIWKKDDLTVFFEVKYRNSIKYWIPEESITKYKLSKCRKTIYYYCKKNRVDFEKIRFDAITILKKEESYGITHYRNIEI